MKVRVATMDGKTAVHNGVERLEFIHSGSGVPLKPPLEPGTLLVNLASIVTIRVMADRDDPQEQGRPFDPSHAIGCPAREGGFDCHCSSPLTTTAGVAQ